MIPKRRRAALGAAVTACAVVAGGCSLFGGSDDGSADASSEVTAASVEGPCPERIVVQTDWLPEAEHGGLYQLIGPGGTADGDLLRYRGPLRSQYRGPHGVSEIEIRAGGAAIDNRAVADVMQADPDIYFGYISTDDAVSYAVEGRPFTAVAGTLEISPQMLMWSPARHSVTQFDDLARTRAPILYFPGSTYMDFLVAEGYVDEDQIDDSYTGDPSRWLESNGDVIQQGFATNEVYFYENELDEWGKEVDFFLIHWFGYENYPSALSIQTDRLEEEEACLELFVPIVQQGWVDYFANPEPIAETIVSVNETYDTFWQVSKELSLAAVETMRTYRIAANGPDDTYGNFDEARVERFIAVVQDVLERRGVDIETPVETADVVTNDFIDPDISLPPAPLVGES